MGVPEIDFEKLATMSSACIRLLKSAPSLLFFFSINAVYTKMPLSSDHFLSKWLLLALWGVICCLGAYIICMIFHEVLKLELSFLGFH